MTPADRRDVAVFLAMMFGVSMTIVVAVSLPHDTASAATTWAAVAAVSTALQALLLAGALLYTRREVRLNRQEAEARREAERMQRRQLVAEIGSRVLARIPRLQRRVLAISTNVGIPVRSNVRALASAVDALQIELSAFDLDCELMRSYSNLWSVDAGVRATVHLAGPRMLIAELVTTPGLSAQITAATVTDIVRYLTDAQVHLHTLTAP